MIRQFRSLILIIILFLFPYQQVWACGKTVHLNNYAQPGEDVTEVLQFLVNRFHTIIIDEGEWLISGEIQLRSNVTIKGVDAKKSVLKRNDNIPLKGCMFFYTEKANPDSYVKQDPSDEFNPDRVKYKNISFEDLTIDFYRSPLKYSQQVLRGYNLYGIALIRTKYSKVKNCRFVDLMTRDCNNGYPAIVVYQSQNISVEGNTNECIGLLQATYSNNVFVVGNHCVSSVGTAIEFISGKGHRCINNRVDEVWWDVSCIGVNSADCVVRGNTVTSRPNNISCLTLGHAPIMARADNTIVENNVLHSTGCRSIIIQNGCGIIVRYNECSCVINNDSPEMTSGAIVASGKVDGIYNLKIVNNLLQATGNGNRGCITYRGCGFLYISNNIITANRGVSINSSKNCNVEIVGNTVNCKDYSIISNSPFLSVRNNVLTDGLLVNSVTIVINGNQIEHLTHFTYLGTKWEHVVIEHNKITNSLGQELPHAFLLNASEKTSSYDESNVKVCRNEVVIGFVKDIVSFSENKAAPQLKKINQ